MRIIDNFRSRLPLSIVVASLVLAVSPAADAQRVSLQQLLDRIEALEGDGTEVKITEVATRFGDTTCALPGGIVPDTVEIGGVNFDRGADATGDFPNLTVAFGDLGDLTLCPAPAAPVPSNPTATRIRAALPAGVAAGDYLVAVSVGDAVGDRAEHLHTIGAVGPAGPQGPTGARGGLDLNKIYLRIASGAESPMCDPGDKVLGGGGFCQSFDAMQASVPIFDTTSPGCSSALQCQGWSINCQDGATNSPRTPGQKRAICIRP